MTTRTRSLEDEVHELSFLMAQKNIHANIIFAAVNGLIEGWDVHRIKKSTPKIYCLWTGTNEMSDNRKQCLEQIRRVSECEVVLITPDNLSQYILESEPLHPGFCFLSETHKADYLRTYLMHFHGGGYTDIKQTTGSWKQCFRDLADSDACCCGYKEVEGGTATTVPRESWVDLIGNCSYIFKPRTPFTTEWYTKMMEKMDEKLEELRAHPSTFPQDCTEAGKGYPLQWTELLGNIFHKVSYDHKDKLLRTLPPNVFHGYR